MAITKGLREILPDHLCKEMNYNLKLVPGKSLCPTCCKRIVVPIENVEREEREEYVSNN